MFKERKKEDNDIKDKTEKGMMHAYGMNECCIWHYSRKKVDLLFCMQKGRSKGKSKKDWAGYMHVLEYNMHD